MERRVCDLAVDPDLAVVDQTGGDAPREVAEHGHDAVESLAVERLGKRGGEVGHEGLVSSAVGRTRR